MKTIWDKYAEVLVDYSTNVQKGDLVQIRGTSVYTKDLVKAVYKRVLERGGHPIVRTSIEDLTDRTGNTGKITVKGYLSDLTPYGKKNRIVGVDNFLWNYFTKNPQYSGCQCDNHLNRSLDQLWQIRKNSVD